MVLAKYNVKSKMKVFLPGNLFRFKCLSLIESYYFYLWSSFYFLQKFKVQKWPKEDYGRFYSGDSYIILYVSSKVDLICFPFHFHIWQAIILTIPMTDMDNIWPDCENLIVLSFQSSSSFRLTLPTLLRKRRREFLFQTSCQKNVKTLSSEWSYSATEMTGFRQ